MNRLLPKSRRVPSPWSVYATSRPRCPAALACLWLAGAFSSLDLRAQGGSAGTRWDGGVGDSWFETGHWFPPAVPGISDGVRIDSGSPLIAAQAAACRTLTLGQGDGLNPGLGVAAGASLDSGTIIVGQAPGKFATMIVDDAKVVLRLNEDAIMLVGGLGSGALTIRNRGSVSTPQLLVRAPDGASSDVLVTGLGSSLLCSYAYVGATGIGFNDGGFGACSFTVEAAATATAFNAVWVDGLHGIPARFVVTGQGVLETGGDLRVGLTGRGEFVLKNLGNLKVGGGSGTLTLARSAGSTGTLFIGDPASNSLPPGTLDAGSIAFGAGTGLVSANIVGSFSLRPKLTGTGTLEKSGSGLLQVLGRIDPTVKVRLNSGQLEFASGADFPGTVQTAPGTTVFFNPAGEQFSHMVVDGEGGVWKTGPGTYEVLEPLSYSGPTTVSEGALRLASSPPGSSRPALASPAQPAPVSVPATAGALTSTTSVQVDNLSTSKPAALLQVSGPRTSVNATQGSSAIGLVVGNSHLGSLEVLDGGVVSNQIAELGVFAKSVGTARVQAGRWVSSDILTIGGGGLGTVTVAATGQLSASGLVLGDSTTGEGRLTVDGTNSTATARSRLTVGNNGSGRLEVLRGGTVVGGGLVGGGTGGRGEVLVAGIGSTWYPDQASIGPANGATGTVTVAEGGLLDQPSQTIRLGRNAGGTGTLAIGRGTEPGSVRASAIQFGGSSAAASGTGTLLFNHSGSLVFSLPITGFGGRIVKDGDGSTVLNGPALTFAGVVNVHAGTLQVDGTPSNVTNVTVDAAATLTGSGSVGRTNTVTIVAPGGRLGPREGQSLILLGAVTNRGRLHVPAGAKLAFGVTASLVNEGVIDLSEGGTFLPPDAFQDRGTVIPAGGTPRVSAVKRTPTQVTLTLQGRAGRAHQLQRSRTLGVEPFTNVGTPKTPSNDGPLSLSDDEATATAGFYRVQVSP